MPLLEVWIELQPDATLAHEMLGWAYLLQRETELAAGYLYQALRLDPDNSHAARLLQQLAQ